MIYTSFIFSLPIIHPNPPGNKPPDKKVFSGGNLAGKYLPFPVGCHKPHFITIGCGIPVTGGARLKAARLVLINLIKSSKSHMFPSKAGSR